MRIHVATILLIAFVIAPLVKSYRTNPENGLWVNVCSGAPAIWLSFDDKKDSPPKSPTHSKACHVICCTRNDSKPDNALNKKTD